MKYFYDCEFLEDGKTIDFISIGIVAEDGREYYGVSNEIDTRRVARHNWLMENVMTSIDHEQFIVNDFQGAPVVRDLYITDKSARAKTTIAWDIHDFVKKDLNPEFWAWYGAYDHVCLAQLWGPMIELPKPMPMVTHDLKTLHKLSGYAELPKQHSGNHNALDDARWNVVRYNHLSKLLTATDAGGKLSL